MSRCVLVAESDATELELIATVLARDGFRVLQALEREQAMSLFASEEIALVIVASDISGRGGGAALCAQVKQQKPETRVVILHPSGNDPDARAVLLSRTGCDAVLPSPFRYDALKRVLGGWGLVAPPRPAAVPMSFAVPPPDVASLVGAPSVEGMLAEPAFTPEVLAPLVPPPLDVPLSVAPVAVPIPIPVVFPTVEAPELVEYSGEPIAEEPIADEPVAAAPFDAMGDEPTVKAAMFLQSIADEPTVEAAFVPQPIADEPTVEAAFVPQPMNDEPTVDAAMFVEQPPPVEQPPTPPSSDALGGDWLLAPPPEGTPADGFAGIDLSGGLDSAVDRALSGSPTNHLDLLSGLDDDAARSVAMAVQAYVAESMAFGDEPVPGPDAPPLPTALAEEPPPVVMDAAPELPPMVLETHPEPLQVLSSPALGDWQVTEPGMASVETQAEPEIDALADLLLPPSKGWESSPPPAPPISEAEPPAVPAFAEPPPPPLDADRAISWAAKGASSWSPAAAPRALPQPVPSPPPAPASPPPPVAETPPEAPFVEPPPPPPEALDEPPALPFEAIVQRTPIGSEPRTTLPPSVPPEGDLATTPLPRLLFELYGGTYCGTLRLSRKGVDRIIDVWNGFPVAVTVTPAQEDDNIATLLRDHGRITPEQYKDAKRRANGREAQLLVALGVIDERDLLDAIREQTELRMAASFSWRDGTYKITPSRAPPDSVVLSEVHPVKIIWRGVCEHYDVGSLLAFFSPLRARYIVATEVFPIHYETLGPFLRSVGVAHLLDGKTTFEQALRSDDSHALTIAHTLYVLIVTEMIRAQSRPGEAATFPDTQAQARQSKPVDYRDLTRVQEEVARTYLSLKERDYFAMLQLTRQATEKEVTAAYDKLAKPFKVDNLLQGLPDDVQRRAREIVQLLRRARDTLSSPEERRRYLTRLEDQPPPPPADAIAS